MSFFINQVYSKSANIEENNPYSIVLILVIFSVIFYFTIIKPQKKKSQEHKELIQSISKNDEILTSGGIIGRVVKIFENGFMLIEINDKNKIMIKSEFISHILPKGTIKNINS